MVFTFVTNVNNFHHRLQIPFISLMLSMILLLQCINVYDMFQSMIYEEARTKQISSYPICALFVVRIYFLFLFSSIESLYSNELNNPIVLYYFSLFSLSLFDLCIAFYIYIYFSCLCIDVFLDLFSVSLYNREIKRILFHLCNQ